MTKKLFLGLMLLVSTQTQAMFSRTALAVRASIPRVNNVVIHQIRRAHCHDVLGVSETATKDEIKAAYFKKAKETHPDVGGTDEVFRNIQEAYENALKFKPGSSSQSTSSDSSRNWHQEQVKKEKARRRAEEAIKEQFRKAYEQKAKEEDTRREETRRRAKSEYTNSNRTTTERMRQWKQKPKFSFPLYDSVKRALRSTTIQFAQAGINYTKNSFARAYNLAHYSGPRCPHISSREAYEYRFKKFYQAPLAHIKVASHNFCMNTKATILFPITFTLPIVAYPFIKTAQKIRQFKNRWS